MAITICYGETELPREPSEQNTLGLYIDQHCLKIYTC